MDAALDSHFDLGSMYTYSPASKYSPALPHQPSRPPRHDQYETSGLAILILILALTLFSPGAFCLEIDLVTVDRPNNQADSRTGKGTVPYVYEIGKFDITAEQYCAFLNAVAKKDPHHLYHEAMLKDDFINEIHQERNKEVDYYFVTPGRKDLPIAGVSFFNAARFCNWLENRQPSGAEGPLTTEDGSYLIEENSCTQRAQAHWFIPTENEFYKAAYYHKEDPSHYWSYATQSDTPPCNSVAPEDNQKDSLQKNANYCIHEKPAMNFPDDLTSADLTPVGIFKGSPGPFGTYDMSGNVYQWTVEQYKGVSEKQCNATSLLMLRGGSRYDGMRWGNGIITDRLDYLGVRYLRPTLASCDVGFRVIHCNLTPPLMHARILFNEPFNEPGFEEVKALWEYF
ncbi:MAG: formylglycine-generating enzyme family protein [Verrucomicrobia bacterium]|nr:MAG: formylglycine-generating enzyme family protein [Verrucomicrobiota bacterium]